MVASPLFCRASQHRHYLVRGAVFALVCLCLSGCVARLPEASPFTALITPNHNPPEQQLLDVGIVVFESDLETVDDVNWQYLLSRIRAAETHYMPVVLQQTLQEGGQWGDVRVVAGASNQAHVLVQALIVESNGHTLQLAVTVRDAGGHLWFQREYTEYIGDNVFGENSLGVNDPFQGIYTRIANDLLEFKRNNLSPQYLVDLQRIARLNFATQLAPSVFSSYLQKNEQGELVVVGLPAANDPYWQRIEQIGYRDQQYHDVMQQYYLGFAQQVADSYYQWRLADYSERKRLNEQQRAAGGKLLRGTLLLGLAVSLGDTTNIWRKLGSIGAATEGSKALVAGFDGMGVSDLALHEAAAGFGNTVSTQVIELQDRTISLSGTVAEQYQQWQSVLETMFAIETEIDPLLQQQISHDQSDEP